MPCMCVPVLEMDGGMRMPETMAIARYLAREYGRFLTNYKEKPFWQSQSEITKIF